MSSSFHVTFEYEGEAVEATQVDMMEKWMMKLSQRPASELFPNDGLWFNDLSASLVEALFKNFEQSKVWAYLQTVMPEEVITALCWKMTDFYYAGRLFEASKVAGELDGD